MKINNKFEISQIVYLKTDQEQLPLMVTAILIYGDRLEYEVERNGFYNKVQEFQISAEKCMNTALGIEPKEKVS